MIPSHSPLATFVAATALIVNSTTANAQFQDVTEQRGSVTHGDRDLVLSVFELRDLVDPAARADGPLLGPDGEPISDEALADGRRTLRTNLLDDVRRWIEPPLEKGHTLKMTEGGALIANVPPAASNWIAEFAKLQLEHVGSIDDDSATIFQLDTAIYQAAPRRFDPLGIEEQTRIFPADAPFDPHALDIEVLSAPRLAVFASQPANVSIINQVAYVKEYRHVVVAPGNEEILDPIIDVISDGVTIDTRVVPLPDGRIGVVLDAKITELVRPIPTKEVVVREGMQPVHVGVPEVHRVELVTRVRLAPGETILITGRSKHPDGVVRSPFVWGDEGDRRELALSVRVEPVEIAGYADFDGATIPVIEDREGDGGARRRSGDVRRSDG